ncbi:MULTISPECIES: 2,3-diaminopropionate biosynthesis protein SbnA [Streptomyces]|uniref:2,3-diaminopropionate biosynthesis protein SbnA n=1 Tax=Streptomyces lycii TaxID=2654337 RepID=A0ABQ7FCQ4_9ACTN|nr:MULTISPECIES: 2,3-diaminopropionate biosynthesis protein SbnA [Streptomyces]KAF4406781.1 2,3-diaminopropionate biosynthesis protein SbnA [Streptomyces lycii]PGH49856.1 2,3-diaminopropionate biosynthesis protein SbnA [Streptomyces sp. Ru87]
MPVISTPQEFNVDDLYVDLRWIFGRHLFLKCEGFNFAGSIKLKAAAEMIAMAERSGELQPGDMLVESSSGNMGVAISLLASSKGYRFTCVTDSRCTLGARQLMEALGTEVHLIDQPHPQDGLLGARIAHVKKLCTENRSYVWLNQYFNAGNWLAHFHTTGPELLKIFPEVDVVFVGAGTTGTLMGCARYLRQAKPSVRIVAVDTVGSVTFGTPPGPRSIPGLGTSVRPHLLDESFVDDVVHVSEADTLRACRRMADHGFLFGGSTGTVVSGALGWLAENPATDELTAVTIAPDLGGRYLDTIYNDEWVEQVYGAGALEPPAAGAGLLTRGIQ